MNGLVLKGIGGFYYISDESGKVFECKAAGRFRYENMSPLPGDRVEFFCENENEYGFIEKIMPRRNELTRPPVANITQIFITLSASKPAPDLLLADKILIHAAKYDIKPVILINKIDTSNEASINAIRDEYKNVCDILTVSARTGEGISMLKEKLNEQISCFAGQSAVGKSSVLNALMPTLGFKTGDLSKKTDRGKHTTRHVELILSDEFKGAVLDTPGFSMIETDTMEPQELAGYYSDFQTYLGDCRFTSCIHENEPDCSVKQAVKDGNIHTGRYERYLKILQELKEKRLKKYD